MKGIQLGGVYRIQLFCLISGFSLEAVGISCLVPRDVSHSWNPLFDVRSQMLVTFLT